MSTNERFEKLDNDRSYITACYLEMLNRINEHSVIELIKSQTITERDSAQVSTDKVIQSLSLYFQLMTMVEENAATQYRRKMENRDSIFATRGSWAEAFKIWIENGISEDAMLQTLANTHVNPVLTAHPTEAKRITVIEIHRELYLLLVQRENTALSNLEHYNI
jgi:phosphoenolpyruvate carboxylase